MWIFFHNRIYNGLVRQGVNGEDNSRTWKHPTLCYSCIKLSSESIWKWRRLIGQHENTQHVALLTSYWYEETKTSERLTITHGQDISYKMKMECVLYENANKVWVCIACHPTYINYPTCESNPHPTWALGFSWTTTLWTSHVGPCRLCCKGGRTRSK